MVTIALCPAVPPPTMTGRFGNLPTGGSSVPGGRQEPLPALAREVAQPVGGVRLLVQNGLGGTGAGARRIPAAEVALERLLRGGVVEDRAVRARDRTELAADALVVQDDLGADRRDDDGADGARGHAPALGALSAGVGGVARVAFEGGDPDDGLRRLEGPRLHVRAGVLAAETAGAPLRNNPQDSHACPSWVRRRRGAPGPAGRGTGSGIRNRLYVTQSSRSFNRRRRSLCRYLLRPPL